MPIELALTHSHTHRRGDQDSLIATPTRSGNLTSWADEGLASVNNYTATARSTLLNFTIMVGTRPNAKACLTASNRCNCIACPRAPGHVARVACMPLTRPQLTPRCRTQSSLPCRGQRVPLPAVRRVRQVYGMASTADGMGSGPTTALTSWFAASCPAQWAQGVAAAPQWSAAVKTTYAQTTGGAGVRAG